MSQVILAFAIGVILSPWTRALLLFIGFIFLYALLYFYATDFDFSYGRLEERLAIMMTSIFGFIVGRTLVGFDDPVADRQPETVRPLPRIIPRFMVSQHPLEVFEIL